jgi:hypothetical protein
LLLCALLLLPHCCCQAIGSIHLNPALALAPIPVTSLPVLYKSLRGSEQVTPAEQEEVRVGCACGWRGGLMARV